MLRIGQVEATATQDGKYTDGSVAGGIAATRLRAAAFNAMQEELAHIVESAGLALDINDMTQVLKTHTEPCKPICRYQIRWCSGDFYGSHKPWFRSKRIWP